MSRSESSSRFTHQRLTSDMVVTAREAGIYPSKVEFILSVAMRCDRPVPLQLGSDKAWLKERTDACSEVLQTSIQQWGESQIETVTVSFIQFRQGKPFGKLATARNAVTLDAHRALFWCDFRAVAELKPEVNLYPGGGDSCFLSGATSKRVSEGFWNNYKRKHAIVAPEVKEVLVDTFFFA